VSIAIKVAIRLEVTRTLHSAPRNTNIVNSDVTTASLSTKDIVVPSFVCRSAEDIPHGDVLDHDAVGWVASWTAVEVVLLDVDAVDGDVLNADVLEKDVGNKTGGVGVRLDASSILGIEDDGIGKGDVRHVVVYKM
jgi:hypothetical protein